MAIGTWSGGCICHWPSGSPTYALQYTADDTPAGLDTVTSWLTHSTITGKSATFDGQIAEDAAARKTERQAFAIGQRD